MEAALNTRLAELEKRAVPREQKRQYVDAITASRHYSSHHF